jgi:predicted AlkP superfamily phosphohydrolase/phosphomutase
MESVTSPDLYIGAQNQYYIMTKTLILGLDGADFDILNPMFEADRMPNLQGIAKDGVSGALTSTIPPSTCPGWQSFYTGKSPGNIGIYGFRNFEYDSYDVHVPDSSDLTESTYWELLGDRGLTSGIVGGPFTYPPQELDGFSVSGPWTPSDTETFTHPPELSDELRDVCDDDYIFIPEDYEEDEFKEAFDRRTEVATHLLETRDWDIFTLVYRPDPLQHVYWDKDDEVVFRTYEYMDECIGKALEAARGSNEEVNVLVMSDHGFEGVRRRYFHVNQWLEDEGYLVTQQDLQTSALKYLPLDAGMNIASKLGVLELFKRHFVSHEIKEAVSNPLHAVQWDETEAFFIWEQQTGQIYINVKRRFPNGTVSEERRPHLAGEIYERIQEVTTPDGTQVVEQAWLGNDIYSGTHCEIGPDIVFTLDREYKGQGTFGSLFSTLDLDRAEGGHHIDGIMFASGPAFREGQISGAEIIDLAPTILHLMGAPIEEHMDGEVLSGIYADGSDPATRPVETVERGGGLRADADWSDEQKDEIEERLEGLGYL